MPREPGQQCHRGGSGAEIGIHDQRLRSIRALERVDLGRKGGSPLPEAPADHSYTRALFSQLGSSAKLRVGLFAELDRERLVRLLPRAYLPSHLLELTLERVPVGRRVTQYSNEFLQLLRPLASLGVPFVALRRDVGLLLEEQVQPRVRLRRVGCGRRLKLCNLAGERVLLEAQGALRFFALDKRCARLLAQAHRLVLCLALVQPREHGASKEAAKHPEYHEPDQPDGQPPRRSERRVALPGHH